MAVDLDQMAREDAAFNKQSAATLSAAKSGQSQQEPSFLQKWVTGPAGRITSQMLDDAVSAADSMYNSPAGRKARDVVSGAMTGAANIADAGHSLAKATEQNFSDLANPDFKPGVGQSADVLNAPSPIWDHAKQSILDFRDAVAVQDPTFADNLVQGVSQLAIPFAGYSRALAGVHGIANAAAAGAFTDATALGPHDTRMADLIALGRHTEGKLGEALRTLAPDGSAFDAYVNFLADRSNESEAEGRFKNVLDGFGANLIATPLIHAAATVIKQGTAGLRYVVSNGVGSMGDFGPPSLAKQAGKITFHGTDAQPFGQFDSSRMGTGEGNQAYGWGHYLADNKQIAARYGGTMARVDVDDNALADMMHWDKPLSEQPEVAAKLGVDLKAPSDKPNALRADMTGQQVYRALAKGQTNLGVKDLSPRGASEFLAAKGIPGMRYLDAGSRSGGEAPTHNTVLFDPSRATLSWGE